MNSSHRVSDDSLPPGWERSPLSQVAKLTRGLSWRKSEESTEGVPVVTIPNIHDGVVGFEVAYRLLKEIPEEKRLSTGDVLLVGSSGSIENIGRAGIVPASPFAQVTYASFIIRAAPINSRVTREFLGHLLTGSSIDYRRVARRAADGKWNLQLEELKNHPVIYPRDEAEQVAICEALAAVSRARESHRHMTDALDVLFGSLRGELLAGRQRVSRDG